MISCLLKKELGTIKSTINIVWTKCEDSRFKNFISRACNPCNIIDFDQTYFGMQDPSIIICNHRLVYMEKCLNLSRFFHCPIIIIDHESKPDIVSNKIDTSFDISPIIQVAISQQIYLSWNKIHDYVLDYNTQTEGVWKNLIYNTYKQKFIMTNTNINAEKKDAIKK